MNTTFVSSHGAGVRIRSLASGASLLAAFAFGDATSEIFRCTVDGRVVYSDHRCGDQSTKVIIEVPPPAKADAARNLQEEANLGRVVVGMVPAQVEQAWGRPVEINTERDSTGTVERWIYKRTDETTAVHFQGGKVSKVTTAKSLAPPATAVAPEATGSFTVSELEDRERRDRAGERRFARAGMTQEEVRGKLGPPSDRRVTTTRFGIADCWTYQPAPRDAQTVTTLCFSVDDARLVTIERSVQR
jgi:hypothetical protein